VATCLAGGFAPQRVHGIFVRFAVRFASEYEERSAEGGREIAIDDFFP
jgi:hypothetical protein